MAGIFSGHVFEGMGQTLPDAASDALISQLVTSGGATSSPTATGPSTDGKTGYSPYSPYGGDKVASAATSWTPAPTAPAMYAPASNNTALYVVGGVAVVGIFAALLMMSGRRRVVANRRRKRSR